MSVFVDYVILRQSYDESLKRLKELLDRKEEAFTRTLPSAIRYDLQRVVRSPSLISPLDEYVMDIEKIDQQIREARIIVIERREMLDLKEQELRESKDTNDRIFVLRFLEHWKVDRVARKLYYSVDTIWYRERKIKKVLEKEGLSSFFK